PVLSLAHLVVLADCIATVTQFFQENCSCAARRRRIRSPYFSYSTKAIQYLAFFIPVRIGPRLDGAKFPAVAKVQDHLQSPRNGRGGLTYRKRQIIVVL